MKKNKLFSLGMLAALLAFGLVPAGCDNPAGKLVDDPVSTPATGVTITEGETEAVAIGGSITLHATKTPADSTDQVVWSSDAPATAAVDASGVVSGVAAGTVTITATAGSVTDTITVTVLEAPRPATGVEITEETTASVAVGGALTLHAAKTPADSTDQVAWSSSDDTKATVDASGVVSGVAAGTVTITATAGNVSDTITVTVKVPAAGITINQGTAAIVAKGGVLNLHVTVTPGDSTDPVVWSSGVVIGKAAGTVTITVEAGGKTDTIAITVQPPKSLTWTDVSISNLFTTISGIAYGGGKFVGYHSNIMAWSDDYEDYWVEVEDFKLSTISDITYGDEKFVAVGSGSGSEGKAAWSGNGVTWTAVSDSKFGADLISGIAYDGGRFVAVGSGGTAWSSNGENWSAVADSTFDIGTTNGIVYDGKKFVAVGYSTISGSNSGKLMYSNDQE
jgi:uncharacterized protein YjdB